MKNQFSALLKEVISLSREEAIRLKSDAIGTGHLLLALIKQDHNMTILLLKKADIALPELQKEIEACILQEEKIADGPTGKAMVFRKFFFRKSSSPRPNGLPLTRNAEKAIRAGILEAKHLQSTLVEPEHLLLSILNDTDDSATRIFDRHGLTHGAAEARIRELSQAHR
jgi:ATP-dependent Clp protease ATP-binding subunit ClpC